MFFVERGTQGKKYIYLSLRITITSFFGVKSYVIGIATVRNFPIEGKE